jgi:methyl-accepting chemotaxis protein
MIERLQTATKNAVAAMEAGQTQAQGSVQNAAKADESLRAIAQAVQTITEKNSQIAHAAELQNSTSGEVSRKTDSIVSATARAADQAQQVTTAAQEIRQLATTVQQAVRRFKMR